MSTRYTPLLFIFLILLCARTSAFNVYRLGGTDGNPWQTALSYEPGDYLVLEPDGTVGRRLDIAATSTHPTWQDTLTERIDSVGGQWLRPFFIPDTLNLAQDRIPATYSRPQSRTTGSWLACPDCRGERTPLNWSKSNSTPARCATAPNSRVGSSTARAPASNN